MSHRNARLTVHGRRLLVQRVQAGRPVAHVAAEMGISRVTAHKWVRRWREEGEAGLPAALRQQHRPRRSPRTIPPRLQLPSLPHRTRRPTTDQPCQQRSGSIQLALSAPARTPVTPPSPRPAVRPRSRRAP
ncbi:leucine zipper domain-containing protein [Streptomyces albidoflavus]